MEKMKYKQCIKIGKNIADIMKLPCIRSCEKSSIKGVFKFKFYPLKMTHPVPYLTAWSGDWLCENEFGKWDILNSEQYEKMQNDERV